MTDQSPTEKTPKKPTLLFVGALVASAALGTGSYVFVKGTDLGIKGNTAAEASDQSPNSASSAPEYLPLDPVFVTLARTDPPRSLRFEATLELYQGATREVDQQMPRLIDLTNTYLRATEFSDLREPAALMSIRAQLLRRYETVIGESKIRNLLVTKFLIN